MGPRVAPPSAASILKEACGGQKPPDITRKITACVACRKLKIKCFMTNSKPPCVRCKGRGLSCTVNKSIQMILDSDVTWKEEIQQRVEELETQLTANVRRSAIATAALPQSFTSNEALAGNSRALPDLISHRVIIAPTVTLNLSCSLGAFPAGALTGLPVNDQGQSPNTKRDLISRGIISEATAQDLYQFYHHHLDHYIYNLLAKGDSLSNVRSRSSLLTSAICAVAAFCKAAECFQGCLNAFRQEVSTDLFSRDHSFDDIRALCIGSFWLSDISTALCAMAVRFASELNLHRCITKMPHIDPKCYNRTRLYFVVVICDHQCSLKHGRPPMTRALRSLQNPRALLRSRFSIPEDIKLISHLELWTLNSRVLDTFGADVGTPFPKGRSREVEQLGQYFVKWKEQWFGLFAGRNDLGQLAVPMLDLYFHAARLCLFSHVFRGPTSTLLAAENFELASNSVASALAFTHSLMENRVEAHRFPSYFGTITAFATLLLLGVCSPTRRYLNIDRDEIVNVLLRLSGLLNGLTISMHRSHALSAIVTGLDTALDVILNANRVEQAELGASSVPESHFHYDFSGIPDEGMRLGSPPNIDWTAFPVDFTAEFPTSKQSAESVLCVL